LAQRQRLGSLAFVGVVKQWIAQSTARRVAADSIVRILVKNGYSSAAALAAVKEAGSENLAREGWRL
jgi:hypothetical protein